MDEKTTSRDELVQSIQKLIEESPVLAEQGEIKASLLSVLPNLDEARLQELQALLRAESTDWEAYFQDLEAKRQQVLDEASRESLSIQKEAQHGFLQQQEVSSHEDDQSRADDLLNQF
ncbi:MAG: hypothetical protein AB7J40_03055 [Candidatus Altimarinota bacterium]